MGKYKLSQVARDDLRRIYLRGLKDFGEAKADEYFRELFDRFDQLAEQPHLYQSVNDIRPGYRRSVCGVDSIYYRIEGDTVEIMAILGQQDIDTWL